MYFKQEIFGRNPKKNSGIRTDGTVAIVKENLLVYILGFAISDILST